MPELRAYAAVLLSASWSLSAHTPADAAVAGGSARLLIREQLSRPRTPIVAAAEEIWALVSRHSR